MTLLLDTHTFLWFVLNDPSLSTTAKGLIITQNDILISPAIYWEIAIKVSIGKYQLPGPFADFMDSDRPERPRRAADRHRPRRRGGDPPVSPPGPIRPPSDRPGDRRKVPILSADVAFDPYPFTRVW